MVAETTGARYFRATDTQSLRDVYTEIDRAEKTRFEAPDYADYRELYPWLLWPALALLALELVLATRAPGRSHDCLMIWRSPWRSARSCSCRRRRRSSGAFRERLRSCVFVEAAPAEVASAPARARGCSPRGVFVLALAGHRPIEEVRREASTSSSLTPRRACWRRTFRPTGWGARSWPRSN
jgi:hypothetical protein